MLRQFSPRFQRPLITIQAGEYYVTRDDEVLTTILGSCVAVCIRDSQKGIGGMNHFMLPESEGGSALGMNTRSARYGMYAMELVIGGIIKRGGGREALEAKVFGGGHVLPSAPSCGRNVSQANLDFVRRYLALEEIPLASYDVGGLCGRKIFYLPQSGRALVKRLEIPSPPMTLAQDSRLRRQARLAAEKEDFTLFED